MDARPTSRPTLSGRERRATADPKIVRPNQPWVALQEARNEKYRTECPRDADQVCGRRLYVHRMRALELVVVGSERERIVNGPVIDAMPCLLNVC